MSDEESVNSAKVMPSPVPFGLEMSVVQHSDGTKLVAMVFMSATGTHVLFSDAEMLEAISRMFDDARKALGVSVIVKPSPAEVVQLTSKAHPGHYL